MVYTIGAKLAKFPRTGAIFSRLFFGRPRQALQTAGFHHCPDRKNIATRPHGIFTRSDLVKIPSRRKFFPSRGVFSKTAGTIFLSVRAFSLLRDINKEKEISLYTAAILPDFSVPLHRSSLKPAYGTTHIYYICTPSDRIYGHGPPPFSSKSYRKKDIIK